MNTDGKVKKESKYKVTAKGINTINFYSFNFGFIDHEEAVMYCCLLQESERFGFGWFFWNEKDKMQYGRKTYDRLRDRLSDKGLLQVVNGGHNNKQNFLVNYEGAINQIETLFKEHREEMTTYLESGKEKQKVRIQSQEKMNIKSGLIEVRIKEETEEKEKEKEKDDSIPKLIIENQQKEHIPIQSDEKDHDSILEEKMKQQQQPTAKQIDTVQVEMINPFVCNLMKKYPFLKEKKSLTDEYLMTEKQCEKLKLELKKIDVNDIHVEALLNRIKECRAGKAEVGKLIEDIIKYVKTQTEQKQQLTSTPVQFEGGECEMEYYSDDDLPFEEQIKRTGNLNPVLIELL
jgi:hypothetical protein